MRWLEKKPRSERLAPRRWVYALLAVLSAAFTTWALHVTQEAWRPPAVARHEGGTDAATSAPEIEALQAELGRIQRRLEELRSGPGR